jgi:hypothetical protein
VHLRFQADTGHADGLFDALLVIDDEFLRQDVNDLLIGRYRYRPRGIDDPIDVARRHLFVPDRDDAVGVEAADVIAGDAGIHRVDLAAGHQLRFLDGALNRLHRGLDVDDDAFLQAPGWMNADTDDFDAVVLGYFADDGRHLGCTDIQTHDQFLVGLFQRTQPSLPLSGTFLKRTAKPPA